MERFKDGCEFCDIVRRRLPAEVINETENTLAFFPLEPATRGHTMVIPKQHVDNFLELDPSDVPELGQAVLHVSRALSGRSTRRHSAYGQAPKLSLRHAAGPGE